MGSLPTSRRLWLIGGCSFLFLQYSKLLLEPWVVMDEILKGPNEGMRLRAPVVASNFAEDTKKSLRLDPDSLDPPRVGVDPADASVRRQAAGWLPAQGSTSRQLIGDVFCKLGTGKQYLDGVL